MVRRQSIDTSLLLAEADIAGYDAEETAELCQMLGEARAYVDSYAWAEPVRSIHMGIGIGGVVAIFLFEFDRLVNGTDQCLWVVCGDLPSAYLVTDRAKDPARALAAYCDLMAGWACAILENRPLTDHFPVDAAPTAGNARALLSRVKFLVENVLPAARKDFRPPRA